MCTRSYNYERITIILDHEYEPAFCYQVPYSGFGYVEVGVCGVTGIGKTWEGDYYVNYWLGESINVAEVDKDRVVGSRIEESSEPGVPKPYRKVVRITEDCEHGRVVPFIDALFIPHGSYQKIIDCPDPCCMNYCKLCLQWRV